MTTEEILEKIKRTTNVYKVRLGRKSLFDWCCNQRMQHIKVYIRRDKACGIPEHAKITIENQVVCLCCGEYRLS